MMYGNYTAKMEEVLQVGTITVATPPDLFEKRLAEVLDDRIALVVDGTNVTSDAMSGFVKVLAPGVTSFTDAMYSVEVNEPRRRLQTASLDTSGCDVAAMRVSVALFMESASPAERDEFIANFQATVLPALIANITGDGVNAAVCASAVVTAVGREMVDAPPPPPSLGLTTPPSDPLPTTVYIVAAIVGALLFVLAAACMWYFFGPRTRDDDEKKRKVNVADGVAETSSFLGKVKGGASKRVGYFVLDTESVGGLVE